MEAKSNTAIRDLDNFETTRRAIEIFPRVCGVHSWKTCRRRTSFKVKQIVCFVVEPLIFVSPVLFSFKTFIKYPNFHFVQKKGIETNSNAGARLIRSFTVRISSTSYKAQKANHYVLINATQNRIFIGVKHKNGGS